MATKLKALVEVQPDEARKQLREAFREAGAVIGNAAAHLGVSRQVFIESVTALELREEFSKLTKQAREEGWLGGKPRGRPKGAKDLKVRKTGSGKPVPVKEKRARTKQAKRTRVKKSSLEANGANQ